MMARWVVGVVIGALAVACAEPPPAKKKAPACDPTTADCTALNSPPKKEHNDGALKTTTGSPLAAPDDAETEAKKARDAKAAAESKDGKDTTTTGDAPDKPATEPVPLPTPRPTESASPPSSSSSSSSSSGSIDPLANVGPKCTKLWACCYDLRQAGITGSANQCDNTALGNDELTCDVANENYKTPDDNYDPVCF